MSLSFQLGGLTADNTSNNDTSADAIGEYISTKLLEDWDPEELRFP